MEGTNYCLFLMYSLIHFAGYMGNLSPDEIVRRIEGDEKTEKTDEKTKSKGGQRSSNNNANSKVSLMKLV